MTAVVKGCCVKIRCKLERNYTNTKDKKIRAATNHKKNVIDKSHTSNFWAAINFQEAPRELIYILLFSVAVQFAMTHASHAGLRSHYIFLIENY